MDTREGGSWGLSSASVHTHKIRIYTVTIVVYYACFQTSQYIDIQSKEERQSETNKERETHSGDAYIFTDVDGYCVCVMLCLSLQGIVYGLEAMDYRLQTIAHRLQI